MIVAKDCWLAFQCKDIQQSFHIMFEPIGKVKGIKLEFSGLIPCYVGRDTFVDTDWGEAKAFDLCPQWPIKTVRGILYPISVEEDVEFEGVRVRSSVKDLVVYVNGVKCVVALR